VVLLVDERSPAEKRGRFVNYDTYFQDCESKLVRDGDERGAK